MEVIKAEEWKEKRLKRSEQGPVGLLGTTKQANTHTVGVTEAERDRKGQRECRRNNG